MKNFDSFQRLSKEEMNSVRGGVAGLDPYYLVCLAVSPDGMKAYKYVSMGISDGKAWMDCYIVLGWTVVYRLVPREDTNPNAPLIAV
jgi:hypothetical protein